MSNHRSMKSILLHHSQVTAGRARRANRALQRHYTFEINRTAIKIRVEAEKQYLAACALVFLMGLGLVTAGLFYIVGGLLYG